MDNPLETPNPYLDEPALFREGMGVVICHPTNPRLVMTGLRRRRMARDLSWQLPQGGLDPGEDPMEGLFRELEEETGLSRAEMELVAVLPVMTSYKWLDRTYKRDDKDGQAHQWVVLRKKTAALPDPRKAKDQEFDAFRWDTMARLVQRTPPFRSPIYQVVAQQMDWWLGVPKAPRKAKRRR